MHEPSLVKILWHLLKLSSGNANMGVSRADNYVKILQNLPISNSKPDLHNINAHTKFGENPLKFTQIIIGKRNTDRRTNGQEFWFMGTYVVSTVILVLMWLFYSPTSRLLTTQFKSFMCHRNKSHLNTLKLSVKYSQPPVLICVHVWTTDGRTF